MDAAIRAGLVHHREGRLAEAQAIYQQVLQSNPRQVDALHLLGMVAFQTGHNDAAIEFIKHGLTIDASGAEHHHDLGDVMHHLGRFDEAVAAYRTALSLDAGAAGTHFGLGNALAGLGQLDAATASYRTALTLDPHHAEAQNNLGIALQRSGRLDDAATCYRQALARTPNSSELHFNLGNVLRMQNKLDEAKACYRAALALAPHLAAARYNLAAVLQYEGNLDAAHADYREVLAQLPDHLESHYNLGLIHHRQQRFDDAIAAFRRVLSLLPDYWPAHNALANVLAQTGRLDDAVESYGKTVALKPDHAEAHNNLGNLLYRQRQTDAALASYRVAVALRPDYAAAHNNIANVLAELGQADAAMASYQHALSFSDTPEFRANFARHVASSDITVANADLRALIARALSEPWARPADLARAAVRIIKSDPAVAGCVTRVSHSWPAPLDRAALFGGNGQATVYHDTLLRALLESTAVCDFDLERVLTMMRRILLDAACSNATQQVDASFLTFHAALARQCFINEYVFACDEEEADRVAALRVDIAHALSSGAGVASLLLLAVAAYAPLKDITGASLLLRHSWPASVAEMLHQQIAQPVEELRLRHAMPRLTDIDADSSAVRQQYEENPYPRWVKLPVARAPLAFDEYLGLQLRSAMVSPGESAQARIDVLIAGCGTGQETIEIAGLIRGADVLAIDLSLASLCYAQRQTDDAKIPNVAYAQADITRLGGTRRVFDVISSVGVLHHTAEPQAALRVLADVLRPGGHMRLGLYSERARANVTEAREFVVAQGYSASAADIRRSRQALAGRPMQFAALLTYRDFYSTSECRDLLFHVREHRFTLLEIKKLIADAGLVFLGFNIGSDTVARYRARFPDDTALTDLDSWHRFEDEFPDAFLGMYVFWVQKPAPG